MAVSLPSGSCEVTPGKQFTANELQTRTKLNQLGMPIVRVGESAIGAREINEDSVRGIFPNINRNWLINGNFDVWQRGGYVNLVGVPTSLGASAGNEYGPDRWSLGTPDGAAHRTVQRLTFDTDQTDVPNSPNYYVYWNQTTADAAPIFSQAIEDVRTMAGKEATLTWWMKSDSAIVVTAQLKQNFGGGPAITRDIVATSGGTNALTASAAWKKFEAHFTIPTLAGYTDGGSSSLILQFLLPNSTFKIYFAQVQLEQSTIASDFEVHPYLYELERCQRYFEITEAYVTADVFTLAIPVDLASITTAADVLTNYTPGYGFKLLSWQFVVTKPVTTAAKTIALNLEIGTTNVTGGVITLTSANCTPLGAIVSAGSAISAANLGAVSDNFSIEAATVTAFSEGQGILLIKIQKTDTLATGYFATRKYKAPTMALVTGYSGTGATFAALFEVGFYQTTPHSLPATIFLTADAEI